MKTLKLALLALLIISCNSKQKEQSSTALDEAKTKTSPLVHLMVGDKLNLSDYKLNPNNGKSIEKDKLILLDFWATWCGPCIASFPHLEEVQEKYGDKLQILAISDESDKKIESFLDKKPFDLAFFNNEDKTLFRTFDVKNLPTTILISEKGKFLWIGRSENIESVLQQYMKLGTIEIDSKHLKLYNKYYQVSIDKKTHKKDNNQMDSKRDYIAVYDAEDYDAFLMNSSFRAYDKPADINFKSIQISDAVATLLEIEPSRFINPRQELDSMIIDVIAKSETGKYTNRYAIDKVIEDLQLIYEFDVIEKHETVDVLKLVIVDGNKLDTYLETTDGGGMARRKDDKEEFIRLNLGFIASILEKRIKTDYVVYEGKDERNFTFNLNQFGSVEELKQELNKIGLALEKGKAKLRFVEIE